MGIPFDIRNTISKNDNNIESFAFSKIPPWLLINIPINLELTNHKKSENNLKTLKTAYSNLIKKYSNAELIFTDGSKTAEATSAAAVYPTKKLNSTIKNELR